MRPTSKAKAILRREMAQERCAAPGLLNQERSAHRNTQAEFEAYKRRIQSVFSVDIDGTSFRAFDHDILGARVDISRPLLKMAISVGDLAREIGFQLAQHLWKLR